VDPSVEDTVRKTAGVAILGLLLLAVPAAAQVEPALSAEVGSPLKLSANVGLWVGLGGTGPEDPEVGHGLLLQAQPGLGGIAFNVGWTPVALPAWGTQAVGFAVKARYLRTWGDPWGGLEPDQDYVGGELVLAWIVKVSVGVVTRVGSGGGKSTIVTWSLGVGI
jgi:hypothetical protein